MAVWQEHDCPVCEARAGERCLTSGGNRTSELHRQRYPEGEDPVPRRRRKVAESPDPELELTLTPRPQRLPLDLALRRREAEAMADYRLRRAATG